MPVPKPRPRRYVSLQTAAEYLGICDRTLRRLIAEGEIPGYRLGRRMIRVDLAEIDAAMRVIPNAGS